LITGTKPYFLLVNDSTISNLTDTTVIAVCQTYEAIV